MNFQNVLEELDKLYEVVEDPETAIESAEEPEADEVLEIVDDEEATESAAEDEAPKQVVLECSNCGGLVIKPASDVKIDEEADMANIDEACKYCEEAAGYVIVGEVVPYEAVEEPEEAVVEESIEESIDEVQDDADVQLDESYLTEGKLVDTIKKVATRVGADASTVVRCFAELSGSDKLYDMAEYVENKAVLKALMNGNDKVLNGLTKEDIEELEQDIKEYEATKK